ncbi:MAG: D-alanyl-D-alanine carboxypeptidase family protein [Sandaracinaceae bacterium]
MGVAPRRRRGSIAWAAWLTLALAAVGSRGVGAQDDELPVRCRELCQTDRRGHFVARDDVASNVARVDGDDLLAIVDRTPLGALPIAYAPRDLVDLATMRPARASACTPPARQCLRAEAAEAYRSLAAALRELGERPHVSSAFRGYQVQCATFLGWARDDGFCVATESSALPGHSEHQLGTTLDLFTYAWTNEGNKFRAGYGCSPGGRFLREHAHEHGFVLSYPLHADYREADSDCRAVRGGEERVDPRTGYRYEPWHLRYVGRDAALEFAARRRESGPGSPSEITLAQWLAERRGGDTVRAPVCDGCNCDRCATLGEAGSAPCDTPAVRYAPDGSFRIAEAQPRLLAARLIRAETGLVVEANVEVPPNTLTQPPVITEPSGARFRRGVRAAVLPGIGPRHFAPIAGAHRLVIGFDRRTDWPFSAALVAPDRDGIPNGWNARLAAAPGPITVRVPIDGVRSGTRVRIGVSDGRAAHDVRTETAP